MGCAHPAMIATHKVPRAHKYLACATRRWVSCRSAGGVWCLRRRPLTVCCVISHAQRAPPDLREGFLRTASLPHLPKAFTKSIHSEVCIHLKRGCIADEHVVFVRACVFVCY